MRILCVGKIFSGKSTFIDTAMSTIKGKRVSKATGGIVATSNDDNSPNTSKVVKYLLKAHRFIVDMPGFSENGVIDIKAIQKIIQGHVKNKFDFNEEKISEDSESYVKNPELKDKIHVVCFFLDNESVSNDMPKWEVEMIEKLTKWIINEGIPCVAMITKKDKVAPERSKYIIDDASNTFGFLKAKIFPVQNCVNDDLGPEMKQPVINALCRILDEGQEYIESFETNIDD